MKDCGQETNARDTLLRKKMRSKNMFFYLLTWYFHWHFCEFLKTRHVNIQNWSHHKIPIRGETCDRIDGEETKSKKGKPALSDPVLAALFCVFWVVVHYDNMFIKIEGKLVTNYVGRKRSWTRKAAISEDVYHIFMNLSGLSFMNLQIMVCLYRVICQPRKKTGEEEERQHNQRLFSLHLVIL